jgi:hypothetical protein
VHNHDAQEGPPDSSRLAGTHRSDGTSAARRPLNSVLDFLADLSRTRAEASERSCLIERRGLPAWACRASATRRCGCHQTVFNPFGRRDYSKLAPRRQSGARSPFRGSCDRSNARQSNVALHNSGPPGRAWSTQSHSWEHWGRSERLRAAPGPQIRHQTEGNDKTKEGDRENSRLAESSRRRHEPRWPSDGDRSPRQHRVGRECWAGTNPTPNLRSLMIGQLPTEEVALDVWRARLPGRHDPGDEGPAPR